MNSPYHFLHLCLVAGIVPFFHLPASAAQEIETAASARQDVLVAIHQRIERELFDPSLAPAYLARLEDLMASGTLDEPADDDAFALRVHRALQDTLADGHLSLYGPERTQILAAQFHNDDTETGDHGRADELPFAIERRTVDRQEVAIISLSGFADSDDVAAGLNAALGALPEGTALIFDLRGNRGGNARHFRLIAGCLFDAPTPVHAIRWRNGDGFRTVVRSSEPDPVCSHHANSPVYVLVDRHTASTAELMPFILQARGRARIVGEATYGASHAAEFYELPHGFSLMIPIGATYDPATGADWEGMGVQPDFVVEPDRALETSLTDLAQPALCQRLEIAAPGYACETGHGTVPD